jgi:hypothetical protein
LLNNNYIGSHKIERIRGHYEVYNSITGKFVCSGDTFDEAIDELICILKEKYNNSVEEAI